MDDTPYVRNTTKVKIPVMVYEIVIDITKSFLVPNSIEQTYDTVMNPVMTHQITFTTSSKPSSNTLMILKLKNQATKTNPPVTTHRIVRICQNESDHSKNPAYVIISPVALSLTFIINHSCTCIDNKFTYP